MTSAIDHDALASKAGRWGSLLHLRNYLTQLRSWWISLFVISGLESILTVLALGVGMGVVVDQTSPGGLGVPFLQFVSPALVISTMLHGAHIENTQAPMGGFSWHKMYEAAAATPTTPNQLTTGQMLGALFRCLLNGTVVSAVLLAFGGLELAAVPAVIAIGLLVAVGFGSPVLAWVASLVDGDKGRLALFGRLVVLPLTLFSGTYFPLDVLPAWLRPIGWVSPLWHGVNLARIVTLGQGAPWWLPVVHVAYLTALATCGMVIARRIYTARLLGELGPKRKDRPAKEVATDLPAIADLPDGQEMLRRGRTGGNFLTVAARGLKSGWGANWALMTSGVAEPVLYLLAMGLGLGTLMGQAEGATSYAAWIAPALLATSAMTGAVMDTTWNVFAKLKFDRIYEAMLTTSLTPLDVALGEIIVALVRGGSYATAFVGAMTAMGLVGSWWVLAAIPACLLIAFGFAALGMAATSFATTFQQIDWIWVLLMPMFLFSGTFYSVDVYPAWIAAGVKCLPLWHGIEMMRDLTSGAISWATAGHAAYFVALAAVGTWVASTRIKALFLR